MKIVVLDGYAENPGDLKWDEIAALGDLTVYDRTSLHDANEIIKRIGDAQIVLTNKTPITASTMDACPDLRFIGVLATGYNVVDTAAAKARQIPVANVPAYGTMMVAQHAIALLLEICDRVGHHDRTVHEGRWASCPDYCYWDYPLLELADRTLGIIGFGNIGRQTGKIARAMGMRVLAYGSRETKEGREIAEYVDLDTLLRESDVISLHCPALPETIGIINRETIAKMKDGVIILNNARGQLICEQDLFDALESGKVAACGADVLSTEPPQADNPLLKAKNCILTPHISWASAECRKRIMTCTAENIKAFLRGEARNVVNG